MDNDGNGNGRPPGEAAWDKRQDRLKLALRANLKRRKSQARERADSTPASPPSDETPRAEGEQIPDK